MNWERILVTGAVIAQATEGSAGDAVVANVVDHAARRDQPLSAGGLRGKRGADGLGGEFYRFFQFVRLSN